MKTVSFINMKGGVAKTTLCINIADYLVRREKLSILVVDIDPQFNATQCLVAPEEYEKGLTSGQDSILDIFDSAPRTTVSAAHGSTTISAKKLPEIMPTKLNSGMYLLPGNLHLYKLEMPGGSGKENRLRTYLSQPEISDKFDYAFIDTPPTPSVWMSSALLASEYYVVPVKPDPISFTGIDLLKQVIDDRTENFGLKLKCAGVVMTIAERHTTVYKRCLEFLQNSPHWKGYLYGESLPKRTEVAREQANRRLILDTDDDELKLALSKITSEFRARIESPKKVTK